MTIIVLLRPQEAKCVLILQSRIGQSSRAYSSTPDDGDYGQSYLGGQDVCGSKCNTDPFDMKHKPDPWLTLKSRTLKNRRDLYLKSSDAVDRVDTSVKKVEDDVKGSGRWPWNFTNTLRALLMKMEWVRIALCSAEYRASDEYKLLHNNSSRRKS